MWFLKALYLNSNELYSQKLKVNTTLMPVSNVLTCAHYSYIKRNKSEMETGRK